MVHFAKHKSQIVVEIELLDLCHIENSFFSVEIEYQLIFFLLFC